MQTLGILEPTDVIDATLACIIRNMQTDTPVDTYYKHTHIITHTNTGAYRQLPEELVYIKLAERIVLMVAQGPHITCIQEKGSIEIAPNLLTVFQVHQILDVARLVDIRILAVGRLVSARSDAPHIKGSHTVGTTDIELLIIRSILGIAITPDNAGIDMSHQRTILGDTPIFHEICLQFQELSKRILEHLLVFLVPSLSGRHVTERKDIGCLADGG